MLLQTICQKIKLCKAQISKITQSGGSFESWLANLGKTALTNFAVFWMPGLVSSLTSNAINKIERKISGKGVVRARKGFTLILSNKDMNDIVKIIKSLKDSRVLTDGVTEIVKSEMEKRESRFLGALLVNCLIN